MPQRVARRPALYTVPDSSGEPPALCGGRCNACGRVFFPEHRYGCDACGAGPDALASAALEGAGTLEGFATAHRAPPESPRVLGVVRLDAGPEVQVALDVDGESQLRVGGRVAAVLVPCGRDDSGREVVDCRFAPVPA